MLLFATPNNYYYPSHAAQERAWALQQQRQSISNALSMNGLLYRDDYLHTHSPYYGYTTNDLAEYELALSRATRKAAIQKLHRDYNAAIRRQYAALQAQRKEQEVERQLRAAEAKSFLADAQQFLGAYWPCALPVDAELPTQAKASTSKAPVQNKPCVQGRMAELQSIFDHLSAEGTSPFERVPVTSTAPTSSQANVNQEAATKGKGKDKEIRDSDAESSVKDRLEDRLMDQYQSELSNIFQSIVAGLSEGTSPFERVAVTSAAPASTQVNVKEEGTTTSHKGKGKGKENPESDVEEEPSATPAQVASSLSQISSIVSRLEALVAGFQFPAELDFSPSRSPSPGYSALDTDDIFALTYTATNAPLRAQENALSLLLTELDNVPSYGSDVVRDARREVVARVGEALEELEKGVEERRGRARARKADPVSVTVQSSEPENLTIADLAPVQVPVVSTNVFVPVAPAVVLDAKIEASVAEPSVASLPTSPSQSSHTLTAEDVSVPEEEVSEGSVVSSEDIEHADLAHPTPPLIVSITHADADIPAEPESFAPAVATSSFLGSDHSEVNVPASEAEVDTFLLV